VPSPRRWACPEPWSAISETTPCEWPRRRSSRTPSYRRRSSRLRVSARRPGGPPRSLGPRPPRSSSRCGRGSRLLAAAPRRRSLRPSRSRPRRPRLHLPRPRLRPLLRQRLHPRLRRRAPRPAARPRLPRRRLPRRRARSRSRSRSPRLPWLPRRHPPPSRGRGSATPTTRTRDPRARTRTRARRLRPRLRLLHLLPHLPTRRRPTLPLPRRRRPTTRRPARARTRTGPTARERVGSYDAAVPRPLRLVTRRAGPVGIALTAYDIWRRIPKRQRKQIIAATRKHGPRVAAQLIQRRRRGPR
jgi:hypothetical protein